MLTIFNRIKIEILKGHIHLIRKRIFEYFIFVF